MIRALVTRIFEDGKLYCEFAGLSTDTDTRATTGLVTGSRFQEVDTGDLYLFDEEGGTWYKCPPDPEDPESDPA